MRFFAGVLTLGLLALPCSWAAEEPLVAQRKDSGESATGGPIRTPSIELKTTFPDSEIFGVKLVNKRPTTAVVTVENKERASIQVRAIGAVLWTLEAPGKPSRTYHNLTTTVFDDKIGAGQGAAFNYKIITDLHPQDLRLAIGILVFDDDQKPFHLSAYNETVTIVEAPQSIFDPQILFLYLVLLAAFAGTAYFIYKTWVASLFPQQKKRSSGKGGARGGKKSAESAAATPGAAPEGTPTTTGAKTYDESWIPSHHIQRPETNRRKSGGTPGGSKSKAKAT